jgi:hypothetical protein
MSHVASRKSARPLSRPRLEALEERVLPSVDTVFIWNAIALQAQLIDNGLNGPHQQFGPTRSSRAMAIVQAAVFDAVNSIDRSYARYMVEVNAPAGASIDAAAATAAHDTLSALYPDFKVFFDAALAIDLFTLPHNAAREGAVVGHVVARAILAARANDGSNATMSYTPGTAPGDWQPDPLHPDQTALDPQWGNVTPFVIPSPTAFLAPPPPALDNPAYTAAYKQVMEFGGDGVTTPTLRTADQTIIGIFWAYDSQPGLGSPIRHYNQIAETIALQEGNSEVQNARFFALINLAMADSGIVTWDSKYTYNFWRPVTAIRDAAEDGNPYTVADPTWAPLGAQADNGNGTNFTPPFPAYDSGHAGFGAALFTTMADFYGTDNIHFTIGSDEYNGITRDANGKVRPVIFRSYASFSQAAQENALSRIYLGVHWIFDATAGLQVGDSVANFVFANALLPVGQHHDHVGAGSGDALRSSPLTPALPHGNTGLMTASRLLSSASTRTISEPAAIADRFDSAPATNHALQLGSATRSPVADASSTFVAPHTGTTIADALFDNAILFDLLSTN